MLAVPLTTISIYAFGELRESGFFGEQEADDDLDDDGSQDGDEVDVEA